MSAPLLWIGVPLGFAVFFWLMSNRRGLAFGGGAVTLLLTLAALWLPVDAPIRIGPLAVRLSPALQIFGRRFILSPSHQPLLVLIYGAVSLWLWASGIAGWANRLVPYGLAFSALCVAALAVEPFLYAALLLEVEVLLTVPLLVSETFPRRRGVLRFLTLQTLSLPFLLLAGWLLSGVEAGPASLQVARQATLTLALGFLLLLAIFPFHQWLPMLVEENHPYAVSFLLWLFPTTAMLFGLKFLDRYTWLREANQLNTAFQTIGLLSLLIGGVFAASQKHLGRLLGFTVVAENGLSLLALSLGAKDGVQFFFLLLLPYTLSLALWGLSLAILQRETGSLEFEAMQGKARAWPFTALGLLVAMLNLSGMPMLAMFPVRQALWSALARQSNAAAIALLIGTLGLIVAHVRAMTVLVSAPADSRWEVNENIFERICLATGCLILLVGGLFPNWVGWVVAQTPLLFEHLGK